MLVCLSVVWWWSMHNSLAISLPPLSTVLYRRRNGGYTGFTPMSCPSVCPSVSPSVCRQGFGNFLKKLLAQFISYLAFTLMGWVSLPLYILVFLALFSALWWPNIWSKIGFPELFFLKLLAPFKVFLRNSHLCSTRLQNRNLYCIFLDEGGSDQSTGILSPFMGIACLIWTPAWTSNYNEIWYDAVWFSTWSSGMYK